jgi:hypothetical protein
MQAPKKLCYRWSPSHVESTFQSMHVRHTVVRIVVAVSDLGTEEQVIWTWTQFAFGWPETPSVPED